MANPTSGFQLSALPQPLSFPTNIGTVDVGQMQKAYSNAMQNVQDTALFGQKVAQQRAALDYQEQLARSQSRLIPSEEAARISQLSYLAGKAEQGVRLLPEEEQMLRNDIAAKRLEALIRGGEAQARVPFVAPTATSKALADLETARTGAAAAGFGAEAYGLSPIVDASKILGTFQQPTAAPSRALETMSVSVAPQEQAVPAAQKPMTAQQPVQTGVQQTQEQVPQQVTKEQAPLPAGVKQTETGDYNMNGVVIPKRVYESRLISNLVNQGFAPSGNAFSWIKIDRENMIQQEAKIGPDGRIAMGAPVALSANRISQIENARNAVALAQKFDPDFQSLPNETEQGTLRRAASVISQREVTNPNHAFSASNPAFGIGNVNENVKRQVAAQKDAEAEIRLQSDLRRDIENVSSDLKEFKDLNTRAVTGRVTEKAISGFLSFAGNVEDYIKQFKGSNEEKSALGEQADILNRMKQIHSSAIPSLIRTLNSKLRLAGGATGGAAGIGRIMFTEIPWLASNSPDTFLSQRVNEDTINRNLARLDNVVNQMDYYNEFYKSFDHLHGVDKNWQTYLRQNPTFDRNGNINNNRVPWTDVLMSDEWKKSNPSATITQYRNVFEQKPKPSGKLDLTKAPPGLTREEFAKWVASQNPEKQ